MCTIEMYHETSVRGRRKLFKKKLFANCYTYAFFIGIYHLNDEIKVLISDNIYILIYYSTWNSLCI